MFTTPFGKHFGKSVTFLKKTKKSFKKVLTKGNESGIIAKLSQKRGSKGP